MNKEMKRSIFVMLLFCVAIFLLTPLWLKILCAFCAGVNFESFMVAWRIKKGENPF